MIIYRIQPFTHPHLCLALNPFKLGVFPIFHCDKSLWQFDNHKYTEIINHCHPDYCIKTHENGDVGMGLSSPYIMKYQFHITKIADDLCTFQLCTNIDKFLVYDPDKGLIAANDDTIHNKVWIINKALDHLKQSPHRLKQANTTY